MKLTIIEALNQALALEMEHDSRIVLCGQDIGKNGGVFRVTDGLQDLFGDNRVFDSPLGESGILGTAVGMAVNGLRPVAEIQFAGFLYLCMNQLVSQAARMRYRSAGLYTCPLVVRAPYGGGVRTPEMHSDSLEGAFLQTPGLKVVVPSNPYDAKGLLAAAIAEPDPVIFLENIRLYRSFKEEVPAGRYIVPLGQAKIVQAGDNLSLFAYGAMLPLALQAARAIAEQTKASIEVIDLRTVWPLDEATIVQSVTKTGRAAILHEAPLAGGVGAEIVSVINDNCLYSLLKPVARIGGYDTPFPPPGLEDYYMPNLGRVTRALLETLED